MLKSFLISLLALCTVSSNAQKNKVKAQLTANSIVKDASGTALPAAMWVPLYQTGKVSVEPVDPSNSESEFTIRKYSKEEWVKNMEKLPKPNGSRAFKNGAKFKFYKEQDLNGNIYDQESLKEKVVVINFWFINCPPCRMEIPELNELVAEYKDNKDVVFLGIALDERYKLDEFLKGMPFQYNIIEKGTYLAQNYGINSFPTHVVIDRTGKIKFHTDGLAQNTVYWVNKSIQEALGQKSDVAKAN